LCNDARTLETLGASNIAITCNTSHYFYKHIQNAVKIPVINMIQESVNYAVHKYDNVKRVGIMATDGTIGSKIYHKACRKARGDACTAVSRTAGGCDVTDLR